MDDFVIEPVPVAKKDVFAHFFQLYLSEHSAFTGKLACNEVFPYPWFDAYWGEGGGRWPFWMRRDEDIAALALVRFDDEDGHYEMAEFFVADRYRGQRLGEWFAKDVFSRFAGRWKLNQATCNRRAIAFWRRVLAEMGDYSEASLRRDDDVERIEQRFTV